MNHQEARANTLPRAWMQSIRHVRHMSKIYIYIYIYTSCFLLLIPLFVDFSQQHQLFLELDISGCNPGPLLSTFSLSMKWEQLGVTTLDIVGCNPGSRPRLVRSRLVLFLLIFWGIKELRAMEYRVPSGISTGAA
ncbi:uncharacterized protein G2W53_029005 [Senna tora]|uniref:Uncharacterized protein n=1 Tax=Senna tora TaxID=362788 RepID=A0A834T4N1_9FABA|nr:uncharacterized protein G2W53_029005 [Senna tora]